jgi:hypothetical protein
MEEMLVVDNPVPDLAARTVAYPLHPHCHRKAMLRLSLRLAWLTAATCLALGVLEIAARRVWPGTYAFQLPLPLGAGNLMLGLIVGAASGLKAYIRSRREIRHYIQLHTYPYD